MPELEEPDGQRQGDKKMPKAPKEKVKESCNHTDKGVECPVHGTKRLLIDEKNLAGGHP